MIQIQDIEGRVTSVLCFLLLLCYHASRDALITALPKIASCNNISYDENTSFNFPVDDGINNNRVWATAEPTVESTNKLSAIQNTSLRDSTDHHFAIASTFSADTSSFNSTLIGESNNYVKNNNYIAYDKILDDIIAYEKHIETTGRRKRNVNYGDFEDTGSDYIPTPLRQATGILPRIKLKEEQDIRIRNSNKLHNVEDICDEQTPFGEWLYLDEWDLPIQGSILGAFHLMTILGLLLGHYSVEFSKVSEALVGALFIFQWGLLSIFTHLIVGIGPMGLLVHRAWQGLAQGACYPCIYRLLEARGITGRISLAVIFTGPWWGSAAGAALGALDIWGLPFYISGVVAFIIGIVFVFLAPGTKKKMAAAKCSWRMVLKKDVVVCAMLHCGSVWVLHTLLIVPTILLDPDDRWWVLLTVITSGGLTAQVLQAVVESCVPYKNLPARGRLIAATIVGFVVTIASLVAIAIEGNRSGNDSDRLTHKLLVTLSCSIGMIFSIGGTSIGYRQVLEVAAEKRRSRALVIVNGAGALGAALASLLMPTMALTVGSFISGCVLPLSLMTVSIVSVFIFLVFPTTKIDNVDKPVKEEPNVYVVPKSNGVAGGHGTDVISLRSADNKSFKSVLSTATFKTAVSRIRSRTSSFNTVLEDVEADMYSLGDDVSVDFRSAGHGDDDMHSIQSLGTSYRSTKPPDHNNGAANQLSFSDLLENGDRTSAWLHLHHQVDLSQWTSTSADREVSPPQPLPGLLC